MNLELRRKALEALGWGAGRAAYSKEHAIWRRVDGSEVAETCRWGPTNRMLESDILEYLPAIESEPAVSEPMFLEWCERNSYTFEIYGIYADMEYGGEDSVYCVIRNLDHNALVSTRGATPSEARALAIIGATTKSVNP